MTGGQGLPHGHDLRSLFAGRRGRLLAGLLLAEFATAVDGLAYATVFPLASAELDCARLYGATLAADGLATLLVLGLAGPIVRRRSPRLLLLVGTAAYTAGSIACAGAPGMTVLLVGTLVRGGAGGLLAGLGLAAIGALYPDDVRPKVLGLFALVWLLPSVAGPVLNAAVTAWAGWRVVMIWPCVLIVAARVIVGRHLVLVPWERSAGTGAPGAALLAVAGVAVASAAGQAARALPSGGAAAGGAMLVGGAGLALAAAWRLGASLLGDQARRRTLLAAFTALCLCWYAVCAAMPLALVEGLHRGPVATNAVYVAGIAAWALTGLRPPRTRRPSRRWDPAEHVGAAVALLVGGVAATGLCLVAAVASARAATAWLGVASVAWFVAGLGMGLAYSRMSSSAFDDAPPASLTPLGMAVAFAEILALGLGALVGSGPYSVAPGHGRGLAGVLTVSFAVATLAAAAALVGARAPLRTAGSDGGGTDGEGTDGGAGDDVDRRPGVRAAAGEPSVGA